MDVVTLNECWRLQRKARRIYAKIADSKEALAFEDIAKLLKPFDA